MISQEHITLRNTNGGYLAFGWRDIPGLGTACPADFCQRSVWRYTIARSASRAAHGAGSKWVLERIYPACPRGDPYKFLVVGAGSRGFKRYPYARELSTDQPFPNSSCILRPSSGYH